GRRELTRASLSPRGEGDSFPLPPLSGGGIVVRFVTDEDDPPMLYAILCYDSEAVVGAWTKEEDDAVMVKLGAVQQKLAAQGRLGPVDRLLPTTAATTIRKGKEPLVLDGPF